MAANTRDLIVRIVGDAKGMNRATKEAETGLAAFENRIGRVGTALASAFAGGAILNFAKDAAKAALEDERAQERLAKTLKNVTGATRDQIAAVEDYIARTETQFAVIDDELRPAFETLVRATKDTAQAQQLLQLALDVSAGSGKGLQEVSVALVKAMGGQMRGLKDLGIQVKTTSGDTASFADVQAQLNTMFAGQAAEAANSQTGRMKSLAIAYENVKENIGRALLPVMIQLADVANSLFGWFNSLDDGTRKFLVQLTVFGGVAFTAVKAFLAIRAAIVGMNVAMAASPLGAFIGLLAGAAALFGASRLGSDSATKSLNDYAKAVAQLGFDQESTNELLAAFVQMTHNDFEPNAKSVETFSGALKSLRLNAKDTGLLLQWFTTPGLSIKKIMGDLSDEGKRVAVAFEDISAHAQDMAPAVETGALSIEHAAEAVATVEKPVIKATERLREWVRQQQIAARESESWSRRTISAYDDAFAHLEALVGNDRLLENLREKQKAYREEIEKHGRTSRQAMAAQRDYQLALAEAAAGAAAAVPGFDRLTEAQQKLAQSRWIEEWARNAQKDLDRGSPLWNALQALIEQFGRLTGSTSFDMISSIVVAKPKKAKAKAAGGPVAAGSPYIVGERGPEMFVPAQSGTIVPNNAMGGVSITVNVTAPGGSDPYSFGNAIVSALRAYVRSNGRIAGIAA